jgi:hypothetical protein
MSRYLAPPIRTLNSGIRVSKDCFDLLPLGIIGVPFLLLFPKELVALGKSNPSPFPTA